MMQIDLNLDESEQNFSSIKRQVERVSSDPASSHTSV
jgi:hypothetical protein